MLIRVLPLRASTPKLTVFFFVLHVFIIIIRSLYGNVVVPRGNALLLLPKVDHLKKKRVPSSKSPFGESREMRGCDEHRTLRDVVIRSNTPYRCGVERH